MPTPTKNTSFSFKSLWLLLTITCFYPNIQLAASENAKLNIYTNSPGATIYLNGKELGEIDDNGFINIQTKAGQYELYIEKKLKNSPFSYRMTQTVSVQSNQLTQLQVKLEYGLSKAGLKQWQNNQKKLIQDALKRIEMLDIPAGSFVMGNDKKNEELPKHRVNISAFKMARFETTFDLYDLYVLDTQQVFPEDNNWGRNRHPVINVSWEEVQKFLLWLNQKIQPQKPFRLPSEAEWEYAARAGSTSNYWWGDDKNKNMANCDGCGSLWDDKSTAPVGSFKANAFGLMDTAGNVYEWVQDCWNHNYEGAPNDGSAWLNEPCTRRVVRGGSWSYFPRYMQSSDRDYSYMDYRSSNDGFRLAQDL